MRSPLPTLLLCCALLVSAVPAPASSDAVTVAGDPVAAGRRLAEELGCAGCHAGLDVAVGTVGRAPDLSFAGLRYEPGHLLAYLRAPERVRRHIGGARMPDFRLSEREALALALFLAAQRHEPDAARAPSLRASHGAADGDVAVRTPDGAALASLLRDQSCLTCHLWSGTGGVVGPELAGTGARLDAAWLRRFLIAPSAFGVPEGVMPALFLLPDAQGRLAEVTPGATARLDAVIAGLVAEGRVVRDANAAALAAARRSHPDVDAAAGARVYRALNCAACHPLPDVAVRAGDAPDLAGEGIRVRPGWLRAYLAKPVTIRPAGGVPGSASRMPDFRLTDAEAGALASFLATRRRGAERLRPTTIAQLDAHGTAKATALLRDELPCLGCHRLGDAGGRIGPDLSGAGDRLEPAFVEAMVRDPQQVVAHASMPRVPMPERTRDLVVRLVATQGAPQVAEQVLSPLDAIFPGPADESASAALYRRDCAPCHGVAGDGDGFNAAWLGVKPTAHGDAAYLATRADDTLYDGIASGGAILGRSHLMPPWGETLSPEEISGLVRHLRALCACAGPAWSRPRATDATGDARVARETTGAPASQVETVATRRDPSPSPRATAEPARASTAPRATAASAPATTAAPDTTLPRSDALASAAAPVAFPPPLPRPAAPASFFRDFVGADACRACHAEQFDQWRASTHGRAGGLPGEVEIIARFDGEPLAFRDATVKPEKGADGGLAFTVEHRHGDTERIEVAAVVGGGHMVGGGTQSFFARQPDGTLRFLPFDFIRGESVWFAQLARDGSWAPIDGSFALTDLANWTPQRVLGNVPHLSSCDVCHGSQIQVLPQPDGKVLTRFVSLAINCESCHGPGRRHVEWAARPDRATIADAGLRMLGTLGKDASLQVCFQCHASRPVLDPDYLPGRSFDDHFALKFWLLESNPYFPDGRIASFSYQDNHQFSDCYVNGSMTCVDCHDPHSQKYRDVFGRALEGRFDDGQCTGCHASKAVDSPAHTHHPEGSAGDACTACHMPFLQEPTVGTKLRFARSDHTIPIPRPEFDASLPVENACSQCHRDRTVADLQAQTEAWWGPIKPHPAIVTATIAAADVAERDRAAELLLQPDARPLIARFAALGSFARRFLDANRGLEPEVTALLEELALSADVDVAALALASLHFAAGEDPRVRGVLARSLADLGARDRAVRLRWASALRTIGAARAQAGVPGMPAVVRAKVAEVLPDGVQDRLWSKARAVK